VPSARDAAAGVVADGLFVGARGGVGGVAGRAAGAAVFAARRS